jgi:hypothetical protein
MELLVFAITFAKIFIHRIPHNPFVLSYRAVGENLCVIGVICVFVYHKIAVTKFVSSHRATSYNFY